MRRYPHTPIDHPEVRIDCEMGRDQGPIWWRPRSNEHPCRFGSATAYLRVVDPYAGTGFNRLRPPVLTGDVQALVETAADPVARPALRSLITLLDQARDQPHIYDRFVGA